MGETEGQGFEGEAGRSARALAWKVKLEGTWETRLVQLEGPRRPEEKSMGGCCLYVWGAAGGGAAGATGPQGQRLPAPLHRSLSASKTARLSETIGHNSFCLLHLVPISLWPSLSWNHNGKEMVTHLVPA